MPLFIITKFISFIGNTRFVFNILVVVVVVVLIVVLVVAVVVVQY